MRNFLTALFSLFISVAVLSQTPADTLAKEISELSGQVNNLETQLRKVSQENYRLKISIDTLNVDLEKTKEQQSKSEKALNEQIEAHKTQLSKLDKQLTDNNSKANEQFTTLENSLSTNTLYWIIAVLGIALLSIIIFVFLRKQIFKEKAALSKHIGEEAIKLDAKLMEVMETQLHLMKEERASAPPKEEEIDHILALKVADEIVRIQTNLSRMDQETKGLKQLGSSVRRIKDNFEANGYEMVEMLNQPYNEGMKVVANFRPDDSLEAGQQVITRIIKPQVNFKGVMIQSAQIEVSQGG